MLCVAFPNPPSFSNQPRTNGSRNSPNNLTEFNEHGGRKAEISSPRMHPAPIF